MDNRNREDTPPINIEDTKGRGGGGQERPRSGKLGYIEEDERPVRRSQSSKSSGGGGSNIIGGIALAIAIIVGVATYFTAASKTEVAGLGKAAGDRITTIEQALQANKEGDDSNGVRIDNILNPSISPFVEKGTLGTYADKGETEASISGISSSLSSLQSQLSAVVGNVTLLQAGGGGGSSSNGDSGLNVTRWKFRTPSLQGYTPGDGFTYSLLAPALRLESLKIEDDDTYEFYLQFKNLDDFLSTKSDTQVSVELVLVPSENDTLLDMDETYLYTDDMPESDAWYSVDWIDWEDPDFTVVTKDGKDFTRRVIFQSEDFSLPSLEAGEEAEISLVLELHYAN